MIAAGKEQKPYWQARLYEAYAHGRLGEEAKALELYRAIVADGPANDTWVARAGITLRSLEGRAKPDAPKKEGR